MTKEINWIIYLTPVFLLVIRGYTNAIVMLLAILSILFLFGENSNKLSNVNKRWVVLISLALCGQFLGVFFSELLRWSWTPPEFDAPLRLVLSIPLLIVISQRKLTLEYKSVGEEIYHTFIPLSLIVTLIYCYFYPNTGWYQGRLSTYFVDPLYFAVVCQVFALSCLANTLFGKSERLETKFLYLALMATGFYLAIQSKSRTGMLGVPFVVLFFIYNRLKYSVSKFRLILCMMSFLIGLAIFVFLHPTVHDRFLIAIHEVASYKWNSYNEVDTSVGLRISFVRMAWFYFSINPIVGWGDLGWIVEMNRPEISAFASEFAREFPRAGFHNEVLTNAVHFGIFGLVASLSIFLVPFIFFYRNRNQRNQSVRFLSIQGCSFVAIMFVSSLSTEVLSIKFSASFYGFIIALTAGSIIQLIQSDDECQKELL